MIRMYICVDTCALFSEFIMDLSMIIMFLIFFDMTESLRE